jgi:hypothetical protein
MTNRDPDSPFAITAGRRRRRRHQQYTSGRRALRVDNVVRLNVTIHRQYHLHADKTPTFRGSSTCSSWKNTDLTIEAGAVVKGEQGSVLVVTRGAKIPATHRRQADPADQRRPTAEDRGLLGGPLRSATHRSTPTRRSIRRSPTRPRSRRSPARLEGVFGGTDRTTSGVLARAHRVRVQLVADREFTNSRCGVATAPRSTSSRSTAA